MLSAGCQPLAGKEIKREEDNCIGRRLSSHQAQRPRGLTPHLTDAQRTFSPAIRRPTHPSIALQTPRKSFTRAAPRQHPAAAPANRLSLADVTNGLSPLSLRIKFNFFPSTRRTASKSIDRFVSTAVWWLALLLSANWNCNFNLTPIRNSGATRVALAC